MTTHVVRLLKDAMDWGNPYEDVAQAVDEDGHAYVSIRLATGGTINLPSGTCSHSVAAAINALENMKVSVDEW
jgi:hypothetical protein